MSESREQWLKDTEKFFRDVKSYNTTIITVGYATFFGLLVFLQGNAKGPLIFWSCLCVTLSATIFVAYEIVANIKLAIETRKAGNEGRRFFRFWAIFFIPSLLLGTLGTGILVFLFLCNLKI